MSEKTKKCAKCGEEIMASAKKCKHCNSDLRSWFARHPIITIVVIIPLAMSLIVALVDEQDKPVDTNSQATQNSSNPASNKQVQEAATRINEITKKLNQVQIASKKITKDSIGTPILNITFKNNSPKTVDAVTVEVYLLNNFDEPISEFNSKEEKPFRGVIQEKIKAGGSYSSQWNLAVYDLATKIKSAQITRVHFTDGEDLSLE